MKKNTITRKAAMILAHSIKNEFSNFSEALKFAWSVVKTNSFALIKFFAKKYNKEVVKVAATFTANADEKFEGMAYYTDLAAKLFDKSAYRKCYYPIVLAMR